jgi:hypothetical protein
MRDGGVELESSRCMVVEVDRSRAEAMAGRGASRAARRGAKFCVVRRPARPPQW